MTMLPPRLLAQDKPGHSQAVLHSAGKHPGKPLTSGILWPN